jgi:hypothetical protein
LPDVASCERLSADFSQTVLLTPTYLKRSCARNTYHWRRSGNNKAVNVELDILADDLEVGEGTISEKVEIRRRRHSRHVGRCPPRIVI